jgi:hypothetical protein
VSLAFVIHMSVICVSPRAPHRFCESDEREPGEGMGLTSSSIFVEETIYRIAWKKYICNVL